MATTPATTSQIANKPASNAVTVAMDPKAKAADVDRKLKFFGVIQAFRSGRYPDNKQIDETLRYTIENSPVDVEKLSPEGQKLVSDVRAIIESMRQLVLSKNSNEEFQHFLHATIKADYQGATPGVAAPVTADDAKKDAETAGEAFRTLLKLWLRNGEARKLFRDLGLVGRDIFADAASFTAQQARPDEDKLATVDQPAPENEFHDDIPEPLKKIGEAIEKKDELKQEAINQGQAAANAVDPNATAEQNKQNVAGAVNVDQAANKLPEVSPETREKADAQLTKAKETVLEHKDKTVNYFKEQFPEQRRDLFIYRLKKVLVECQRHRDYQDAMEFFLTAFENYKGHAEDVHAQVENNASSLRGEGNLQTAERSFRTLIERFANGHSTQPMFDAADQIYVDVKNDGELKSWFTKLGKYIRACLQQPGFVMKDEANTQAREIRDSGKRFFSENSKYRPHFEHFFNEVEAFFKSMGDDPENVEFGRKWHALGRDLFFNAEGKPTFKPELWKDIRDPILPQLVQHIGFVPLPRIEFSDPTVDLVIENLTMDAANLIPNWVEIDGHSHMRLSAYAKLGDEHRHSIKLTLGQIQCDMRDVKFDIRKKKGFPTLKESGTADVLLAGQGLTVTVHLETASAPKGSRRPPTHVFTVKQVKAKIDKLTFAIRDSKHDLLVKILKPLASSIIKKQICKAAEQGIRDALEKADAQLVQIRDADDSLEAIKQKAAKGEQQVQQSKQSAGTFKIATSKRDSILPQLGNRDGWVNRLDEREKAANAQLPNAADWHSPAFSIVGNASAPGAALNGAK